MNSKIARTIRFQSLKSIFVPRGYDKSYEVIHKLNTNKIYDYIFKFLLQIETKTYISRLSSRKHLNLPKYKSEYVKNLRKKAQISTLLDCLLRPENLVYVRFDTTNVIFGAKRFRLIYNINGIGFFKFFKILSANIPYFTNNVATINCS